MEYTILQQPYFKEAINVTEVQIYCNSPYTVISRDIVGDVTKKTNDELVKLVLDQVAAEYDPTEKINRLDRSIAESDKAIDKIEGKVKEVDGVIKKIKEQAEMTQLAVTEAIEQFTAKVEELKGKKPEKVDPEKVNTVNVDANDVTAAGGDK